jgi:hypothetical protein
MCVLQRSTSSQSQVPIMRAGLQVVVGVQTEPAPSSVYTFYVDRPGTPLKKHTFQCWYTAWQLECFCSTPLTVFLTGLCSFRVRGHTLFFTSFTTFFNMHKICFCALMHLWIKQYAYPVRVFTHALFLMRYVKCVRMYFLSACARLFATIARVRGVLRMQLAQLWQGFFLKRDNSMQSGNL